MHKRVTREQRVQSPGEEIANSVSAGVGLIGAIAGIPLLLAFRKPTGQQLACCRCVGLRCDDPLALSRVHDLSRAAAKQNKAALSVARSYGNLSSDRRNLHAVHSRGASRCRGLDAICRGLELGKAPLLARLIRARVSLIFSAFSHTVVDALR